MDTKHIVKTRCYAAQGKTIYYFSDGSKLTRYWQSLDEFCNDMGI